jgi:glycosyltransferase involved in cell wall biosynthesis
MNSKYNKIKDVAIWGTPPPPYGGMTIHISRLLPILRSENISYVLYAFHNNTHQYENTFYAKNFSWLLRMLIGDVERIHYVITVRPWLRFFAVLFGLVRRRKVIIRIGGSSLKKVMNTRLPINKYMSVFTVRYASAVIGVNNDICQLAIALGAKSDRVYNIPGFIYPQIIGPLNSTKLYSFLQNKWPRIITTGVLVENIDRDIYGIGMSIEMINTLIDQYPNMGLLIFAQSEKDLSSNIITKTRSDLKLSKLDNSVLVTHGTNDFLPALAVSDVFVRPTLSDGDANSVREALYLNIPVIASDCVIRPPGTITFQVGNLASFVDIMKTTLNNLAKIKIDIANLKSEDNSKHVINLINQLKSDSKVINT